MLMMNKKKKKGGAQAPPKPVPVPIVPPWAAEVGDETMHELRCGFPFLNPDMVKGEREPGTVYLLDGSAWRINSMAVPFTKPQMAQVMAAATLADAAAVSRVIFNQNIKRRMSAKAVQKSEAASARFNGVKRVNPRALENKVGEFIRNNNPKDDGTVSVLGLVNLPIWKKSKGFLPGIKPILDRVLRFVCENSRFQIHSWRVEEILKDIERFIQELSAPKHMVDTMTVHIYPQVNLSQGYWGNNKAPSIIMPLLGLRRNEEGVWCYVNCRRAGINYPAYISNGEWIINVSTAMVIAIARQGIAKSGIRVSTNTYEQLYMSMNIVSDNQHNSQDIDNVMLNNVTGMFLGILRSNPSMKNYVLNTLLDEDGVPDPSF